jgi:hypothetical protein
MYIEGGETGVKLFDRRLLFKQLGIISHGEIYRDACKSILSNTTHQPKNESGKPD